MTDQPTEGRLAVSCPACNGDAWVNDFTVMRCVPCPDCEAGWKVNPAIPAVSVAESDRRVAEARQAERARCLVWAREWVAVPYRIAAGIESGEPA